MLVVAQLISSPNHMQPKGCLSCSQVRVRWFQFTASALFLYLLEPASHYSMRCSDQNTEFTSFCQDMLYSCAWDDILINSFVAGGYFGHDMRCRMVTGIGKACQIVRNGGNLSLLHVKCSVCSKGLRLYFENFWTVFYWGIFGWYQMSEQFIISWEREWSYQDLRCRLGNQW